MLSLLLHLGGDSRWYEGLRVTGLSLLLNWGRPLSRIAPRPHPSLGLNKHSVLFRASQNVSRLPWRPADHRAFASPRCLICRDLFWEWMQSDFRSNYLYFSTFCFTLDHIRLVYTLEIWSFHSNDCTNVCIRPLWPLRSPLPRGP